ncbi:hypothetical protein ACIQ4I_15385 [Rummeliibacillus sp. NPDC094406]|uniref:hypothetical protein n=1 Tax=Rummeliibacillus sp. NPDC094406 TaxID=3364511 RepID=UPI0037F7F97E
MDKLILNTYEAIQLTIDKGFDGSELNLKVWKEKGRLNKDRSLKGLISKLETLFDTVTVEGGGKKMKFILEGEKTEQAKRIHGNQGKENHENIVIKEYIFSNLVKCSDYRNLSYKGWGIVFGFPSIDENELREELTDMIKNRYLGYGKFNPSEVVSEAKYALDKRRIDTVELAFKHLESENRIKIEYIYTGISIDDNTLIELTEIDYEAIKEVTQDILKEYDVSYYEYITSQSKIKIHKDSVRKAVKAVKEMLHSEFKIYYAYKTCKVTVLKPETAHEVSKDEMLSAYFTRLLELSKNRANRFNNKSRRKFWHKYYYNNMILIIDYLTKDNEDGRTVINKSVDELKKYEEKNMVKIAFDTNAFEKLFS